MRRSNLRVVLGLALIGLIGMSGCAKHGASLERAGVTDHHEGVSVTQQKFEQVCAHSYEVLIAPSGVGSPAVRGDFMVNCMLGAQRNLAQIGEVAWDQRTRCMLAGQTPTALTHCSGRELPVRKPLSEFEGVQPSEACEHLLSIMDKEFGGGLIPAAELPKFTQTCIEQFEQARSENPIKFEREVRCMLSVSTLDELERCEQD